MNNEHNEAQSPANKPSQPQGDGHVNAFLILCVLRFQVWHVANIGKIQYRQACCLIQAKCIKLKSCEDSGLQLDLFLPCQVVESLDQGAQRMHELPHLGTVHLFPCSGTASPRSMESPRADCTENTLPA